MKPLDIARGMKGFELKGHLFGCFVATNVLHVVFTKNGVDLRPMNYIKNIVGLYGSQASFLGADCKV